MELYQLRQFAAVAKYENMTRAAESLNVAQPAVSKTIRNLESELGAELFERTGKGLRRTEQGDILLRYARTILEAERDARGEIEESLHRTGGLCICALSCAERISEILAGFSAEYGNLDLRISSTPEGSDLLLDSAVSRDEVPAGAVLLYDEEMCVAVPEGHRYADRESVSLTELADDPFIALSNSQSFRQISEHIFRSAGVEMHAAIECDSAALQIRLLSCGMGVALVASGEWRQVCEDAGVRLLHIKDAQCRRYIYVQTLGRFRTQCICALSCAERISEILAGFSAEYGNLDLRISSTPEGSDLLLDSAVSRDEVPAGAVLLYDEEMCVAVPEGHRYADRESVSLTELADDPFIALSNSQSFRQISEHIFRSAGVEMHAAIECDSAALQIRLLSCGMGVALVASGEWRQVCEDAGVRLLHIKDAQCRRYIYVQTLGRFRTQSIRAFTAYLERYFAQMA